MNGVTSEICRAGKCARKYAARLASSVRCVPPTLTRRRERSRRVLAAVDVRLVARLEPQPEQRLGRPGHAREHSGQFVERPDRGEAPRLAQLRVGQPVLAERADLTGRLRRQVERGRAGGRVEHHRGVQIFVAGEVVEVVVLAEPDARLRFGAAEQDDRALAERLRERLAPGRELRWRIPEAFRPQADREARRRHHQRHRRQPPQHSHRSLLRKGARPLGSNDKGAWPLFQGGILPQRERYLRLIIRASSRSQHSPANPDAATCARSAGRAAARS